jgi:nicotinamidase-related amidase
MDKTALLVIDFINDIVHSDGKIAGSAAYIKKYKVIEHANKAIAAAREQKIPIFFVKVGFSSNYLECPMHSPLFRRAKEFKALQLNSWGTEFHETLNFQSSDNVIVKHRVSAFYATDLETYLRANQIQKLYLCGVSTDMTIQTTAREAHDRDYKVAVIKDACGAMTEELHENTIKSLERIAMISTTEQLFV